MKNIISFAITLLSFLCIGITAFASDYYIYDVAEILSDDEIYALEARASEISNSYECDIYIVTVENYEDYNAGSVFETAVMLYQHNDFGYGDDRSGLILLLSMDNRQYATAAEGYGQTVFTDAALIDIENQFLDNFSDDDWYGGFSDYLDSAEYYLEYVANREAYSLLPDVKNYSNGTYVHDLGEILTQSEISTLEDKAFEISQKYQAGVYIVTVNDYWDFYSGGVFDTAVAIYRASDFGFGYNRDGIVLLLSTERRNYALACDGSVEADISDYGLSTVENKFKDNFKSDDWYGGLNDYLDQVNYLLECAEDGTPFSSNESIPAKVFGPIVSLAISGGIALIVCGILKSMMRSVYKKQEAGLYMENSFKVSSRKDKYINTTRTQVKIERNDSSSSSSGGGSFSSGGMSGRSGSF